MRVYTHIGLWFLRPQEDNDAHARSATPGSKYEPEELETWKSQTRAYFAEREESY